MRCDVDFRLHLPRTITTEEVGIIIECVHLKPGNAASNDINVVRDGKVLDGIDCLLGVTSEETNRFILIFLVTHTHQWCVEELREEYKVGGIISHRVNKILYLFKPLFEAFCRTHLPLNNADTHKFLAEFLHL